MIHYQFLKRTIVWFTCCVLRSRFKVIEGCCYLSQRGSFSFLSWHSKPQLSNVLTFFYLWIYLIWYYTVTCPNRRILHTVLFSMKLLRKSSISVFPSKKSSATLSDSSSASCAATFNLACRALALQLWKRKSSIMLVHNNQKSSLERKKTRQREGEAICYMPYIGSFWGNLLPPRSSVLDIGVDT